MEGKGASEVTEVAAPEAPVHKLNKYNQIKPQ